MSGSQQHTGPHTSSTHESLRTALRESGLCPDCACAKDQHGAFGWTGCDQRFTEAEGLHLNPSLDMP